ncbi:hypothetical protein Syun_030766 [Stephania yunnanensis]|uniref:IMP dehydrogenase/GMP reductase domain-containing protein n=1 Tax=Stephania yunnanensis TaxID=152371 RepID=A0AAP0HG78_9MAGN
MDTVSESSMAVSMAALGGIAIVHYNNTPSDQYSIIRSAKSRCIPFAFDPIFKSPSNFIDSGDDFASSPYVFVTWNGDSKSELPGLVSRLNWVKSGEIGVRVGDCMEAAAGSSQYDFDQAASFMARNAVDWAPLVSGEDWEVVDVFSAEDVEMTRGFSKLGLPSLEADGDFMLGAAMGTREEDKERLEHLVRAGANVVVLDSSPLSVLSLSLTAIYSLVALCSPLSVRRGLTSNKPYSVSDGSNPFFDGRAFLKFNLRKSGVHSGHVQKGLLDPFCLVPNGKGK